jgi:hydrogenase maturation protease
VTAPAVVIAIGNRYRSDDGVGVVALEELRRLAHAARVVEHDGEPSRLLDLWAGTDLAIVIDACRSGASPGTVHDLDAIASHVPAGRAAVSGHGVGLAEAIGLARALGRLPPRLRIVAVEARDLGPGTDLSPAVQAAVPTVVRTVLAHLDGG